MIRVVSVILAVALLSGCTQFVTYNGKKYAHAAGGEMRVRTKEGWVDVDSQTQEYRNVATRGTRHQYEEDADVYLALARRDNEREARARNAATAGAAPPIGAELIRQSTGPGVIGSGPVETRDANSDREDGAF